MSLKCSEGAVTDSALDLDPYVQWLAIQVPDRPLTPYQLLRIVDFEDHPQKIKAALERQLKMLDEVGHRAPTAVLERLRAELKEAVAALLSQERRQEIDAAIRRAQGARNAIGQAAERASAGATITCAGCATVNPARRRFCSKCGEVLWRRCPECDSERAIDESYCGECGVDILEAERRRLDAWRRRLDEARAVAKGGDYESALRLLHKVILLEDHRLEVVVQAAFALRRDLAEEREQRLVDAGDALSSAEQRLAAGDPGAAVKLLEAVPEKLRTPELRKLLGDAARKAELLKSELDSIKRLIQAKDYLSLAGPIEAILGIQPENATILQLAGQVKERLLVNARRLAEAHDYHRARETLDAIPSSAVDEATSGLTRVCQERAFVLRRLEQATVVDPGLVQIAERFAEELSGWERAQQLCDEARTKLKQGRLPVSRWRPPPKRNPVKCPVVWQGYPRRLATAEASRPALARGPGQWFTAYGLALQGLGLAPHAFHLGESPKKSFLGGFRKTATPTAAWGVDLGAHSLKAIYLRAGAEGPVVEQAHLIPLGDDAEQAAQVAALQEVAKSWQLAKAPVVASISSRFGQVRTAQLPPLTGKQLDKVVEQEAERLFPAAVGGLVCRHQIEEGEVKRGIFIACRQSIVEQQSKLFETAGWSVDAWTLDCLAIENWRRHEAGQADHYQAVLDIGRNGSGLWITYPKEPLLRYLPCGGEQFTRALCAELKLARTQAESLKVEPRQARSLRRLYEVLRSPLEDLLRDVVRTFEALEQEHEHCPRGLTIIGGGALLSGLIDHFEGTLP